MSVQKSLLFSLSSTFAEYIASQPSFCDLLRTRRREIRLSPHDQSFFSVYPDVVSHIGRSSPKTVLIRRRCCPCWRISPHNARAWTCALCAMKTRQACTRCSPTTRNSSKTCQTLDLPLAVFFDDEWQIQDRWGPQPQAIEPYLEAWLERNPEYESLADDNSPEAQARYACLAERLAVEMRLWYNSGLNQACAAEIRELLAGLNEDLGKDTAMEPEEGP